MKGKKDFVKKIWAFTLGDGHLSRSGKVRGNSRYLGSQIMIHKDYIDWQANILEDLTSVDIRFQESYIEDRGYICQGLYRIQTKTHPLYTKMRERIYPSGIKAIDPHYLKLLDWESMAILYQDDGYLSKGDNKSRPRSAICTYNFTYGDNILLKEAIKEKLDVLFDVRSYRRKDRSLKYYLQATSNNTETFVKGITPYILPSFEYKIDLSHE